VLSTSAVDTKLTFPGRGGGTLEGPEGTAPK